MYDILLAHRVPAYRHVYSFAGPTSPVSTRDQMVRAQWIAQRLADSGVLAAGKRLVVVGGGAGGITCAAQALLAVPGCRVTVIHNRNLLFTPIWQVDSRWLDPTEYDWAAAHCRHGQYPCDLPWAADVPFRWGAAAASSVASGWASGRTFRTPDYEELCRSEFLDLSPESGYPEYEVHYRDAAGVERSIAADVVVFAHGPGAERCNVGGAFGYPFWSTDRFADWGAGAGVDRPNVLVAGGGDGALQDVIRLLTKPNRTGPRDAGRSSLHSARGLYDSLGLPRDLEWRVLGAQTHASRHFGWGGVAEPWPYDHNALAVAEAAHAAMAREVLADPARRAVVDSLLRDDIDQEYGRFTWVHGCDHFGDAYGLNRFLVLLLLERLAEKHPGRFRRLTGLRVARIDCGHDPGGPDDGAVARATACHGQPHRAFVIPRQTCEPLPRGAKEPDPVRLDEGVDYHVLVLRLGLREAPRNLLRFCSPSERHILPYSLLKPGAAPAPHVLAAP